MRQFLSKISVFIGPLMLSFLGLIYQVDGSFDHFYHRFTTPKQRSLILGTSRAAQGLQPNVFREELGIEIYNYSFTIAHSPFGKVYFDSIVKKHNKMQGGVFIVTVDPWAISSWTKDPNDLAEFGENKLCLGNTSNVSIHPNFEYLFNNRRGDIMAFLIPQSKHVFLHGDGWLEVSGISMDSISFKKRLNNKLKLYKNDFLPKMKFSEIRLDYLIKTIKYLKEYGEVYLVRLPIHAEMMKIEQVFMPHFNSVIHEAIVNSNGFLDLTCQNDRFLYTDGNHLFPSSGKKVSQIIAHWIGELRKK
jgi:hypothetical protein